MLMYFAEMICADRVCHAMQRTRMQVDEFRALLDGLGIEYLDLAYEDVYENEQSLAGRLRVFEQVISLTGYDLEPLRHAPMLSEVAKLLAPGEKLNSEDTYRLIPNIDDIEKQCGAKGTGYLFRH